MIAQHTHNVRPARHGFASVQTAALVVLVGLLGVTVFQPIGTNMARNVDGESKSSATRLWDERSNPPTVVSSTQSALGVQALYRLSKTWPDINNIYYAERLDSAFQERDAATIGRALVGEKFGAVELKQGPAHTPEHYARTMRLMSESIAARARSADLRSVYDDVLSRVLPAVLGAMRREYPKAFDHFGTDPASWLALQGHAEGKLERLQNSTAVSAADIFDLADAVESAKYGYEVRFPRNAAPIYTHSLLNSGPEMFLDAFFASREVHAKGQPILFPYVIKAPNGAEQFTTRRTGGRPSAHWFAQDRARTIQRTFDEAADPQVKLTNDILLTPPFVSFEQHKRSAFIRETFPGSRLYARDQDDARTLALAFYESLGWLNKVEKVRWSAGLSETQALLVDKFIKVRARDLLLP